MWLNHVRKTVGHLTVGSDTPILHKQDVLTFQLRLIFMISPAQLQYHRCGEIVAFHLLLLLCVGWNDVSLWLN